jgi:ribosomal protein S18 acetylase RimI-like enzyme
VTVVVRPIAADEYADVAELTLRVYGDAMAGILTDAYRAELADVARRAEHAEVLVAADGGRVLGSVTYVADSASPYAEFDSADEAGIRMLVVAPEAQRRGVGAALVHACIDAARRAGRRRLSLHTTADMAAARRLYERLGFHRAPERDGVPEEGVSLLGYVLEL